MIDYDYGYNCIGCFTGGGRRELEANQVEVSYDGKQWIYDDVPADEHQSFLDWANKAFADITNAAIVQVVGEYPSYDVERAGAVLTRNLSKLLRKPLF